MALNWTNLIAFAALFFFLCIANTIIYLVKNRIDEKNYVELTQRMQSWWVMVLLLIAALSINPMTMIVFFMFVSYLALKEYFTIIPTRRVDRRVIFIAYLSIPCQYLWVAMQWYGMFVIFVPIYMFLIIPMRMVMLQKTEGFLKASGTLHWGLMLTVYCISHIAYLGVLPAGNDWRNEGISLVIFLISLTQFNDVSQYVCGKLFGHKKIIPAISPNKTRAGFLGGVITTSLLAILLSPFLTPFTWAGGLFSGLLIAISGFLGDLTMSAVKRDLGIKDTGQLLPGHGGILDRLDSIIFTAPLFFHFARYFYY
ncbi:TPA: phosphatidate cytidylyltransferase [Legionella feeleii]